MDYKKGFTLVELLIVIALLGAIALIVIAAINPIEQANRARDTRLKADGAQLVSAIDRYFAARSEFPWVTVGEVTNNDSAYGFVSATTQGVGVCGTSCNEDGLLITNDELKTEFRNRDFIQTSEPSKQIFIGKAQGTSESVYACFIPMSKAVRQSACAAGNVYTISQSDGSRTLVSQTTCSNPSANWADNGWYICIPE